jgi:hypothetical protein
MENLSNEIFYEIFDYLDGYEICQAFSNLNIRFKKLVMNSSYSMKIEFSPTTIFNFRYEQFLHSNKHRLISFHFNDETILEQFITFVPMHLLFVNLQAIILKEISSFQLLIVLFYLKSSSRLTSLKVRLNDCFSDLGEIYRIIFHLSTLKYLEMISPDPDCDQLDITLPMAYDGEFSSIEYLGIYHPCKLDQLINILSYTPRLTHLNCSTLEKPDDEDISFKLSNLTHLTLRIYYINFIEFEIFLLALCSQLKFLNVDILCNDESYLDADRWERLISHNILSLNKFIFCYSDCIHDFEIKPNHALINRFTSTFWIQRNWIFKIALDRNHLDYSIRPYKYVEKNLRRIKFSFVSFRESWIDPSNHPVSGIQFTARDILCTKKEEFLIDKIKPIFDVIQMTYLNIRCDQMSAQMFIKILNYLPNLTAIRITGLPSHEELQIFDKYNKITKVTLTNNLKMEQIDLILRLFPCIQYLSLQYISDPDIESIVRETLLKIQEKNICHPMTLCIFGLEAEHDKVRKLKQMIDSENLLNDYTLNRQFNRFYFQWK